MSRQETNNDETYYNIGKKYGFKNLVIIGKGGFGCIMLGTKEGDGKVYAIKICIPDPVRNIKLRKEMVDQFRGRNIVKIFYHNLKDDEEYYYIIIMELSYIGDLKHFGNKLYNDLIFKEPFEEKVGDYYEGYSREYIRVMVKEAKLHEIIKVKANKVNRDKIIAEVE